MRNMTRSRHRRRRGEGVWSWGIHIPSRLWGLGSVVSSPSGVGAEPRPKIIWYISSSKERIWYNEFRIDIRPTGVTSSTQRDVTLHSKRNLVDFNKLLAGFYASALHRQVRWKHSVFGLCVCECMQKVRWHGILKTNRRNFTKVWLMELIRFWRSWIQGQGHYKVKYLSYCGGRGIHIDAWSSKYHSRFIHPFIPVI